MFGTRTAALRRVETREDRAVAEMRRQGHLSLVHVGKLPASRQGRVQTYSPDPSRVRTGATAGCATEADDPPGNLQLPCDGLSATQPKPAGSGDVTVPVGGAQATATVSTKHPATVIDYGINDKTGVALVQSIFAGTDNLLEGPGIRTETWQSAKTACPIQKPFAIYPWSNLDFNFTNSTNQAIVVNCWALLRVRRC
jgi:hypothetical protein